MGGELLWWLHTRDIRVHDQDGYRYDTIDALYGMLQSRRLNQDYYIMPINHMVHAVRTTSAIHTCQRDQHDQYGEYIALAYLVVSYLLATHMKSAILPSCDCDAAVRYEVYILITYGNWLISIPRAPTSDEMRKRTSPSRNACKLDVRSCCRRPACNTTHYA